MLSWSSKCCQGFCAGCLTQFPCTNFWFLQVYTPFPSDLVTLIRWGRWFVQDFFYWLVLYWFQGFSPFSLALFLYDKPSNFRDTLKDWCKGAPCSGLCSGSLLGCFWPYTLTPLSFSMCSQSSGSVGRVSVCNKLFAGSCSGKEWISTGSSSNMDKSLWEPIEAGAAGRRCGMEGELLD